MPLTDEDRRCPRCGAAYAETQEYCLECGTRLPEPGALASLGAAWRRRLGWYPGDWVWPALLALVIAAAAGAISALFLADRSSASANTLVATSPAASSVQVTETAPEPTTAPATTSGTTRAAPPPPPKPNQLIAWPAGRTGWTLVLDSLPSHGTAAFAEARQALRKGVKQVGVLDSSRFSSLHPGYFVVFAGIFDSQAEAQSALLDAHDHGYPGAYPREIVP